MYFVVYKSSSSSAARHFLVYSESPSSSQVITPPLTWTSHSTFAETWPPLSNPFTPTVNRFYSRYPQPTATSGCVDSLTDWLILYLDGHSGGLVETSQHLDALPIHLVKLQGLQNGPDLDPDRSKDLLIVHEGYS